MNMRTVFSGIVFGLMALSFLSTRAIADTTLYCRTSSRYERQFDGSYRDRKVSLGHTLTISENGIRIVSEYSDRPLVFDSLRRETANSHVTLIASVSHGDTSSLSVSTETQEFIDTMPSGTHIATWISRDAWDAYESFPVTLWMDTAVCTVDR